MSATGEAREEKGVGFFGREGVEEDEGALAAYVTCSCGVEGGREGGREGGEAGERGVVA